MSGSRSDLLLIIAPVGRDASLICEQLRAAGMNCRSCKDIEELCTVLADEAGAVIATEEALTPDAQKQLLRTLREQPPWSELPIIILTGAMSLDSKPHSFEDLRRSTNVTLVDRPVRVNSLISAAQSAIRARERQYEVRDLMHQLEQRVHERDRFLAVLGHELRNPLGAILLAAQMKENDGKLPGEHADLIERQSRHLTQLVNDLLDLSRVAAGKIVLKRNVLDLREVAEQATRMIMPVAETQRIAINTEIPDQPVLVDADGVRIEQIMNNMLSNAVKYTPEGGHVLLSVGTDNGHGFIRVKDNGVGIAPERIDAIFELFAQAENAIGRAQGGMGIGLALVRNLVQLHEGSVEARSDGVGKGSEFLVKLPLATAKEKSPPAELVADQETEDATSPSRRIVIVEDNPDVRHLLHLKLKRLGHEVIDAADGVEGLRALVAERPDLALVDLGLPHKDGYELAREARQQLGQDVILVAVSGFGQPDDKRRALEAGFDEHITKPADVRDIENILRRFPPRNTGSSQAV